MVENVWFTRLWSEAIDPYACVVVLHMRIEFSCAPLNISTIVRFNVYSLLKHYCLLWSIVFIQFKYHVCKTINFLWRYQQKFHSLVTLTWKLTKTNYSDTTLYCSFTVHYGIGGALSSAFHSKWRVCGRSLKPLRMNYYSEIWISSFSSFASFLPYLSLTSCAILPTKFGSKGPHLNQWLVAQPSSDGLLAEVFRCFSQICAYLPVSSQYRPYH